jgi:hypothetical protein
MASDGAPNKEQVKKQLARMLESKRLQGAPNRHMLLKYVVQKCLANEEISERKILCDLFPNYADDTVGVVPAATSQLRGANDTSEIVRVTAHQLRTTLSLYYSEEGAGDGVRIDLPPGPKYRPVFSYSSLVAKAYARGRQQFAAMTIRRDHLRAVAHMNKAIALDSDYAPAHAALAEIKLSMAAYGQFPDTKDYIALAETSATEALRLSQRQWRPHVVLGIVHSSRCAWGKAEASFNAALRASREDTEGHAWYAAYLLATGRKQKALRLVRNKAWNAPDDPVAQSVYALCLYASRDFVRAEASLADLSDSNHWLTKVAHACILLHRGSDEAWFHAERAHDFFRFEAFPGFHALCLRGGDTEARQKGEAHARQWLPHLKGAHLQSALCHLALGEPEKAIASLRRARDEHDPLMIWAHLWPFLDPLRGHKKFQQLIREMDFPSERKRSAPT